MSQYDVIVIGSGPGGYVSAIRCAQLGMKTAIVEKYPTLGGTCLNVGCIPSKAYLHSSELYHHTVHAHKEHGIEVGDVKLDLQAMQGRVQKVVSQTCDGIQYLMGKNKIDVLEGVGSFVDKNTIDVAGKKYTSKNFVIATGSKPSSLPGIEVDKKRVITSTEALKLPEVPKHLILIGGGVIGVELGSVYARLGSKVSVVEFADRIIPSMDVDCSKELTKALKKEGFEFYTAHACEGVSVKGKKVTVKAKNNKKGDVIELEGDYALVAVGRRAYTDGLGLENIGLKTDDRGRVVTNENLQTEIPHIYAIGDVTKGLMLAHKAEEEGVFVAEVMAGQKPHIHYNLIPGVVYTWPEVAGVGATEDELKKQGVKYKKGSFPFKALGRARASNENFGFVKILADQTTDEILGVHMVGARCADLIIEAVVAMEYRASAEDVARMSHPHPTYSEAFKEAALAATENRPIHI